MSRRRCSWPFPCDPDNYGDRAERSAIEGYKDAYKKAHNVLDLTC